MASLPAAAPPPPANELVEAYVNAMILQRQDLPSELIAPVVGHYARLVWSTALGTGLVDRVIQDALERLQAQLPRAPDGAAVAAAAAPAAAETVSATVSASETASDEDAAEDDGESDDGSERGADAPGGRARIGQCKAVTGTCNTTGEKTTFDSMKAGGDAVGAVDCTSISKCCAYAQREAHGYTWEFTDPEDRMRAMLKRITLQRKALTAANRRLGCVKRNKARAQQ